MIQNSINHFAKKSYSIKQNSVNSQFKCKIPQKTPKIVVEITLISSKKCFWSGPAHKKNSKTSISDTSEAIKHSVKKNCVAIMKAVRKRRTKGMN